MYSANNTSEWLNTLEPKARYSKLILARKTWQKSRVVFKDRIEAIRALRAAILEARVADKAKRQ